MSVFPDARDGKHTGKWVVDWRLPKGKLLPDGKARYRDSFATKAEADGAEVYVKSTLRYPPWSTSQKVEGPTFKDAAEACKDHGGPKGRWKAGRDKSVLQRLEYCVRILGPVPVSAVDVEEFDTLAESLEDRPARSHKPGEKLSGDTINRYFTAVSAVLHFCRIRRKLFPGVGRPEVPWRPKGGEKIVWYSDEQEAAVIRLLTSPEVYQPQVALCVRFLAASGLRVSELLKLDPADVEDVWVRLWKTKTDRPRSVPVDPENYPGLTGQVRAMIRSGCVPTYMQIYRHLTNSVGKLGFPEDLAVHALRHTTATRLIRKGVNLPIVQKFLGHSNINTTMRYVHVMDDDLLQAAKKLAPTAWENAAYNENSDPVVLDMLGKKAA